MNIIIFIILILSSIFYFVIGTGKSHLVRTMIQAVKYLKLNPNEELRKPTVVVGAPTANAAHIVGGRTIDSIFGFNPTDRN